MTTTTNTHQQPLRDPTAPRQDSSRIKEEHDLNGYIYYSKWRWRQQQQHPASIPIPGAGARASRCVSTPAGIFICLLFKYSSNVYLQIDSAFTSTSLVPPPHAATTATPQTGRQMSQNGRKPQDGTTITLSILVLVAIYLIDVYSIYRTK